MASSEPSLAPSIGEGEKLRDILSSDDPCSSLTSGRDMDVDGTAINGTNVSTSTANAVEKTGSENESVATLPQTQNGQTASQPNEGSEESSPRAIDEDEDKDDDMNGKGSGDDQSVAMTVDDPSSTGRNNFDADPELWGLRRSGRAPKKVYVDSSAGEDSGDEDGVTGSKSRPSKGGKGRGEERV